MNKKEMSKDFGRPMNDWSNGVKRINMNDLGNNLYEGINFKEENQRKLKELGLPMFVTVIKDAQDFINNPEETLSQLKYDRFFVNIINKKTSERNRKVGLNLDEVFNFIDEKVDHSKVKDFQVLLSECPEQPYNGVIIVNSPDQYILEMVNSPLSSLVSKNNTPDYIARKKLFEPSVKYEGTEDEYLKSEMYKIIQLVKPTIGYYEFCLAKTDPNSDKLTPFFFEYSNKETYLMTYI